MNIYIDAGFYVGNALASYIRMGIVDNTWTVYAFEANPAIKVKPHPFVKVINKAVWTSKGKVELQVGGRSDASSIVGMTRHGAPKLISVPSIDFSAFVASLPEDAFILCSMDIEGSEYPVLEKMILDNTIRRIDVLDIEFHDRFMDHYTEEDTRSLINRLRRRGVSVKLKEI